MAANIGWKGSWILDGLGPLPLSAYRAHFNSRGCNIQINDQYGHDVGDELRIAVANRLSSNLRSTDLLSRLGGDEFLVMSSGFKLVWEKIPAQSVRYRAQRYITM